MSFLAQRIIFGTIVAVLLLASWYNYRDLGSGPVELASLVLDDEQEQSDKVEYDREVFYGPFPEDAPVIRPEDYYGPGLYVERFVNEQEESRMSHVSSLVPLDGGDMLAAWYSGSREGAKDVTIYTSRFTDGRWGHAVPLVSRRTHMHETGRYVKKVGNALLARDESGRTWLFYSSIFAGGWSGASLNYKYSQDDGETWSSSGKLMLSPLFNLTNNVKNKALALKGGGFLLPVYHELLRKRSELVRLQSDGRFTRVFMTDGGEAIQPSVVHKGEWKLGAFYRNMSLEKPRRVLYSESPDMGKSWGQLMHTTLKNPNAGLDVIAIDSGLLAVLNNSEEGRQRLTLEHSSDGGRTWDELRVLEDEQGREFSYPFIETGTDGRIHITYTYDRRQIKHVSFDRLWLGALTGAVTGGVR
jgi:predicted neuraminidase